MQKYFRLLVITSIIFIYLIIIAGAVVRMTGSGTGCPDWPKCFGSYIPPTSETQIQWQPNFEYKKGVIVILEEELKVALKNFTSSDHFNTNNWNTYTKHDYAKFNVLHTWIEYVNRMVSVVSGIPILLLFFVSFTYRKKNILIPLMAIITIFAMGFQAWLGKVVVDSNLLPFRITIHMIMAFVILAILIYLLFLTKEQRNSKKAPLSFKSILILSIVLTLAQVALGTQVRQHVDEQLKMFGELAIRMAKGSNLDILYPQVIINFGSIGKWLVILSA